LFIWYKFKNFPLEENPSIKKEEEKVSEEELTEMFTDEEIRMGLEHGTNSPRDTLEILRFYEPEGLTTIEITEILGLDSSDKESENYIKDLERLGKIENKNGEWFLTEKGIEELDGHLK